MQSNIEISCNKQSREYTTRCWSCGKFCRPVEQERLYSGVFHEPEDDVCFCAKCSSKRNIRCSDKEKAL